MGNEWYLPHHALLYPKKTDKLIRVCNASSSYKVVGLSEKLLAGPDSLFGLSGTSLRFRIELLALAADIEQIFQQMQVHEEDRYFLRFLWRL